MVRKLYMHSISLTGAKYLNSEIQECCTVWIKVLGTFQGYTKDDITITSKGQVLEIPVESVLYHVRLNLFLPLWSVSQTHSFYTLEHTVV